MTDFEVLQALDTCDADLKRFEVEFLDSLLKRGPGRSLSQKQLAVIYEMADKYVPEEAQDWLAHHRHYASASRWDRR